MQGTIAQIYINSNFSFASKQRKIFKLQVCFKTMLNENNK